MTKAIEIIRPALRAIGAVDGVEEPKPEEVSAALEVLNGLIDQFKTTPAAMLNNKEVVLTLPAMTQSLSIGDGQDIDVPRPFRIESAYARISRIDRGIKIVDKAEYDAVNLKDLGTSWPEIMWFDGGVPTGRCYFWPLASSAVELHVTVLRFLTEFTDSEASQQLPQGMRWMLQKQLEVASCPVFQLPVPPKLERQAMVAYRSYMRSVTQIPDLSGDVRVTSRLGQFISGGF